VLRLVHWRTIVHLERLPNIDEPHALSSAEEVWRKLKSKAVVVAVIHRWRGDEEADPAGITARQLVVFALWYRERWGMDLELFYWIDCSCLPKEIPKEEKERRMKKDWTLGIGDDGQDGLPRRASSTLLPHLTAVTDQMMERDQEKEEKRETLRREDSRMQSIFGAGPSFWTWQAVYDDFDVTTESSDAFLPLVFACSDAVVVCEAKDSETRAWVHLEVALAYAFAPTGNKMYSVDQKLGIRRRPRKRSVPTGSPSPLMPLGDISTDIKPAPFGESRDAITDLVHPELGSIFGNAESKAIEDIDGEAPQAIEDINGVADGHSNDHTNGQLVQAAGGVMSNGEATMLAIEESPAEATTFGSENMIEDGTVEGPGPKQSALVELPSGAVRIREDDVGSEDSDPDANVKKFAREAFYRTKAIAQVKTLTNPLRWDYSMEGDKERIARLLHICLTEPTIEAAGGYRRQELSFHPAPNIIHMTRLEALSRSRKTKQERKITIDKGTLANAAMLAAMGVPEAVAKDTLGWHEDEEDKFEKEEEETPSEGFSSETASSLTTGQPFDLPGNKFARFDRNDRPNSPNSTRVYAHVRKRLDWEERTMDLYHHHRWHKNKDGIRRPLSASSPAQLLVDKAAKSDYSSDDMSDGGFTRPSTAGLERPSTANSWLVDRPSTAISLNTESLRPSTAQSWNTIERPSTAKSNRSGALDEYDPSGEGPLFPATKAKIEFKNRPFGGEKKEAPRQETAAENLLRRAAVGQRYHTTQSRAKQPLSFYSAPVQRLTEELFHPDFHPTTVLLGEDGVTVTQMRGLQGKGPLVGNFAGNGKIVSSADATSGGLAVTMHQLPIRRGVAPEEADVRGVCFEVIVETVDARWNDGIGIGFTAQDPDRWNRRKPQPRHASGMPKTWVCGYSGRWVLNGRSEMIRPLRGGVVKAWQPGKLQVGDIVTAVAAPPPANVFRILVNGHVVAERPLRATGLVNPEEVPLWGVVDVDGSCVSVRLRGGTAYGERPKSAQSTLSTRSRSEPRTLLGSTVPLGIRTGALGPDRKRPATSESFRSQERKRPATSESPVRPTMSNRGNRAMASSLSRSGLEERPGTAPTSLNSGSQRPGTAPPGSMYGSQGFLP